MTDVRSEPPSGRRLRFRTRAAADMVALRRWSRDPSSHQANLHALVHRLAGAAGIITDAPGRSAAIADVVDELGCLGDQAVLD